VSLFPILLTLIMKHMVYTVDRENCLRACTFQKEKWRYAKKWTPDCPCVAFHRQKMKTNHETFSRKSKKNFAMNYNTRKIRNSFLLKSLLFWFFRFVFQWLPLVLLFFFGFLGFSAFYFIEKFWFLIWEEMNFW